MAVKVGSSSCALLRRIASKARGTKRRGKEGSTRSSSAVVPNLVGAGSRSVRLTLTLILILTPTLTLTPTPTLTLTRSRAPGSYPNPNPNPGPPIGCGVGMYLLNRLEQRVRVMECEHNELVALVRVRT